LRNAQATSGQGWRQMRQSEELARVQNSHWEFWTFLKGDISPSDCCLWQNL